MSELRYLSIYSYPELQEAIIKQVNHLVKEEEYTETGHDFAQISCTRLGRFFIESLERMTESTDGIKELTQLWSDVYTDGCGRGMARINRETIHGDPHDSLHISNVPRIKELNNHVFSTLQKGQDLF